MRTRVFHNGDSSIMEAGTPIEAASKLVTTVLVMKVG